MGKIYIGTSGWQYRHWREVFYPEKLPRKDWLRHYSEHFETVEINSSFYQQTKASTFEKWISETPTNFVFSIKGNRYITHIKRLKDCREPVGRFFKNVNVLAAERPEVKCVILWQLPPSLKKDLDRFTAFLSLLPENFRHAFEFRHRSWTKEIAKENLGREGKEVAAVLQDWKDWPCFNEPIGDFVYIRLHGREKLYSSGYSEEELEEWAGKVQEWGGRGLDVYVYFNNDALGYAVKNALFLKTLLK